MAKKTGKFKVAKKPTAAKGASTQPHGNRDRPAHGGSFMSASTHVPKQYVFPIITCPECGNHMRLSTIVPEEYRRERMTFMCECGFDYRQSSAVAVERGL
jgi:RNase P subunit RPR2